MNAYMLEHRGLDTAQRIVNITTVRQGNDLQLENRAYSNKLIAISYKKLFVPHIDASGSCMCIFFDWIAFLSSTKATALNKARLAWLKVKFILIITNVNVMTIETVAVRR